MPKIAINYIELLNSLHNNKYNYSNSIFKTQKDKFKYICPIHNEVEQTIACHMKYGCSLCFNSKVIKEKEQNFINKATEKFGDKFTYDYLGFRSLSEKVTINCKIHRRFSSST